MQQSNRVGGNLCFALHTAILDVHLFMGWVGSYSTGCGNDVSISEDNIKITNTKKRPTYQPKKY
jgi:hypothetical protein